MMEDGWMEEEDEDDEDDEEDEDDDDYYYYDKGVFFTRHFNFLSKFFVLENRKRGSYYKCMEDTLV